MEERPKIGLSGLVLARVIKDDENGIVYDTPFRIPGAVVATINPNSSVETDYADDGAFFAQNNRGNTELSLEMIDITPESEALMLGQRRVNGVTVETDLDQSPYFAFGGKILRAGSDENGDAVYEYIWYAKGKFSVPESGGETKRDSLTFGHKNLTAQFVKTQFVPDGQKSGTIGTKCRTDDSAVPSSLKEHWFDAPVISVSQSTSAVTVTASSSEGTLVITGTKGSSESFTFARETAKLGETIIITDAGGELVNGSLAFGGTATAPTITFTPAEGANSFTAVTVTSGLKDNNGIGVTPMTDADL
jgi:phi13 family phage major tail protein